MDEDQLFSTGASWNASLSGEHRSARLAAQVRTIGIAPPIADTAVNLPKSFPGDPADRLIFATAIALGYWKPAIILEGVYARYSAGGYGKVDPGLEHFARLVERFLLLYLVFHIPPEIVEYMHLVAILTAWPNR